MIAPEPTHCTATVFTGCPAESRRSPDTYSSAVGEFPRTSVRVRHANPNHHLWNNNGTWYMHYTVHPTPLTKERVRVSLETKSIETARQKRDTFLAGTRG